MRQKTFLKKSERGFSLVELLIVVTIIAILGAITTMSLLAPRKYKAEDQALLLIDLMREAQQRAISQKKTMRVEIDSANRQIRLINENEPNINNAGVTVAATTANDETIKTVAFNSDTVFVGLVPTNMTSTPTEATPVTTIPFTSNIAVMRFMQNGTVHNAGTNNVGSLSIPTGRTIYVWKKKDNDPSATPTVAEVLRAVTVLGSSGSAKLWKCGVERDAFGNDKCNTWTR